MQSKMLRCYAEGSKDSGWQAICVDLDIAVQGTDFEEVYRELNEAIDVYVETVNELPEEERAHLFKRRAPFFVRAKYLLSHMCYFLRSDGDKKSRHDFVTPSGLCPT